jgi:3-deoxy-D-manno-octulosonate 8-phosphate phosphatase (KDO 8-P phosphatase)
MAMSVQFEDITALVLDVDGVLTPGDVTLDGDRTRTMSFSIHDGYAIRRWMSTGHKIGLLSGRRTTIVRQRAEELGIQVVHQGVAEKGAGLAELLNVLATSPEHVCYIGDDVPDVAAMKQCTLAVAVADATPSVKRWANLVTRRRGGRGAVAEMIEYVLRKQHHWNDAEVSQ